MIYFLEIYCTVYNIYYRNYWLNHELFMFDLGTFQAFFKNTLQNS